MKEDTLLRFGRYRVERLIGSGPVGAVFLGRDPILGRPVAIKRIALRDGRRSEAPARELGDFEAAFSSLGSLAHPHIVTVHDVGIQDGQAFLVSEYVTGTHLGHLLRDGPMDTNQITALGSQIATALDFAHGHGISHGGLKPSNVLVAASGPVKVSDFGVAIALARSGMGHSEWLTSTPWHLAPELIMGDGANPASDQWSLAVLIYQMLTGELPFDGDSNLEALEAITERVPVPPTVREPSLPTEADLVLLRALDRDPSRRYATCGDLARRVAGALGRSAAPIGHQFATQPLDEDLRRMLEATQPLSTPDPPLEQPVDEPRGSEDEGPSAPDEGGSPRAAGSQPGPAGHPRRRRLRGFWGAAAVAVLVLTAILAWQRRQALRSAEVTPSRPPTPWEGNAITEGEATAPRSTDLHLQVVSELADGVVVLWIGNDRVFAERFQFGGPARFLRGTARGGRMERVIEAQLGLQTVRVQTLLPGREVEESLLMVELSTDPEPILEVKISRDQDVEARFY